MPTALLRGGAAALLALTLAACGSTTSPSAGTPGAGTSGPAEPAQGTGLAAQAVATPVALSAGQTQQLNVTVNGQPAQPGQLKWTTSNAAVATVTQTGLVTAIAAGSATVRAALATNPGAYLDFPVTVAAVTAPVQTGEDEAGHPVTVIDARVSARVRLAPTHVFELMKALEQQLSQWEAETGNTPGGPSVD